jgi:hypothetical protein
LIGTPVQKAGQTTASPSLMEEVRVIEFCNAEG